MLERGRPQSEPTLDHLDPWPAARRAPSLTPPRVAPVSPLRRVDGGVGEAAACVYKGRLGDSSTVNSAGLLARLDLDRHDLIDELARTPRRHRATMRLAANS